MTDHLFMRIGNHEPPPTRWQRLKATAGGVARSVPPAVPFGFQFAAVSYWIAVGNGWWALAMGFCAGAGLIMTIEGMLIRMDTRLIERDIERMKDARRKVEREMAMAEVARRAWNADGQSVQVHDLRQVGFLFPHDKSGGPL